MIHIKKGNIMKKIIKTLIFCVIIFIVVFVVICRLISQNYEYSIGRDTHKAFGNREYQILTYTSMNREKQYCLYNFKYNEPLQAYFPSFLIFQF